MAVAFDPLEFVTLAGNLVLNAPGESGLRTAVGRLYYGLFLLAREKTRIIGRNSVHGRTITAVKSRPGYWATGCQLDDLRHLRTVADYELIPEKSEDTDWQQNWRRAQLIVSHIRSDLESL